MNLLISWFNSPLSARVFQAILASQKIEVHVHSASIGVNVISTIFSQPSMAELQMQIPK